MSTNILKLVRSNVQKLIPYQSARRIGGEQGDILLNANESSEPVFFKSKKKSFHRYPEGQPKHVISSYANYTNLFDNQILVTRGADEGIELLIKAFCEPGQDAIMYCPPTYDMYRVNAEICGVEIKEIPTLKNTWQLDLSNIQLNLSRVKLVYVCNPNNPTGNVLLKKDLIMLLKMTLGHSLVVIDEAYIEFSPKESMTNYLKKYPNLVILRTLSKAFALAGIRCGFTLANREIIDILNKVISPYPIPIPVSDIACQALERAYIELMQNRVLDCNNNRAWLIDQLKNLHCVKKVFESHANYILVKFFMFKKVFQTLWDKGIILRNQHNKMNLKNCIRISIGTRLESFRVIEELKIFSKEMFKGKTSEK